MKANLIHKRIIIITTLVAICLIALFPHIVNSGFIAWTDWHLHLFWAKSFAKAINEGIIYPRWLAEVNGNYGGPIFIFYAPLSYFYSALIEYFTNSTVLGLKSVYFTGMLGIAGSSYLFFQQFLQRRFALLAACLIILMPQILIYCYRLNLPPTIFALAFTPLTLYFINQPIKHPLQSIICIAVSYAACIMSHTLTGMQTGIICGLFCLFLLAEKNTKQAIIGLFGLICGVLLSSIYLLPALVEQQYVHFEFLKSPHWQWSKHFLFSAERDPNAAFAVDTPYFNLINGVLGATVFACLFGLANSITLGH